jgi:hypothetical protein
MKWQYLLFIGVPLAVVLILQSLVSLWKHING